MRLFFYISFFLFCSCKPVKKIRGPRRSVAITGSEFYTKAARMQWKQRDSLAVALLKAGDLPPFLKRLTRIRIKAPGINRRNRLEVDIFVTPDYLAIGTKKDWARVPLTPMAAQQIADTLNCFLPTRKIVNEIYAAAKIRLEPLPMYTYRDSTPIMWRHHQIIETQRNGRKGLIAGIKKDVVISSMVSRSAKPNRVAIFGWHTIYQKPVQPLYAGHVNTYVDYSHGIRLVYRQVRVKIPGHRRKWLDYEAALKDPSLQKLLCDEPFCDFYRYTYQN